MRIQASAGANFVRAPDEGFSLHQRCPRAFASGAKRRLG
jgi:hypothetical protein